MGVHAAAGPPVVKMQREQPVRHVNRNKLRRGSRLQVDVEADSPPVFSLTRYTGRHRRSKS